MNEQLKELIDAGEKKIEQIDHIADRISARENERIARKGDFIRRMYPEIADFIVVDEGITCFYDFKVVAPECKPFNGQIFFDKERGGVPCKEDPTEEEYAFWERDLEMFEDDIEIALAIAHRAWKAENNSNPVYGELQEGA